TMASDLGASAAGIVLSGTADDGQDGLRAIRAAGGLTIAQAPSPVTSPEDQVHDAGTTEDIDLLLAIDAMAGALVRFASLPRGMRVPVAPELAGETRDEAIRLSDAAIDQLAAILEGQAEFDLRVYKTG